MKVDFRPPKTSPLLLRLTYLVLPAVTRLGRRIRSIDSPPEEWELLLRLRARRFILTPNHPSSNDPLIAFSLARRLGCEFNYLACRELFVGPYGWLLQRLGCYSILRGAPDRESIRTTRSLLAEHDRQLVIFPEGEIYGHNDMLLPFQSGVVQLGFWTLETLDRLGKDLSLPVVPLVVKYLHLQDARPGIAAGLSRLEKALALPAPADLDAYARLRRAGETILSAVEREYHLRVPVDAPVNDRIDRLKRTILERVSEALGVAPPAGEFASALHALLAVVYEYSGDPEVTLSEYERKLRRARILAALPLYHSLWRLQNMLAVRDGYVAESMTSERFVEVLNRLETEVLGRPRTHVACRALLRIAEPLELAAWMDAYRESRRPAVQAATGELQARMRRLHEEVATQGTPLNPQSGSCSAPA